MRWRFDKCVTRGTLALCGLESFPGEKRNYFELLEQGLLNSVSIDNVFADAVEIYVDELVPIDSLAETLSFNTPLLLRCPQGKLALGSADIFAEGKEALHIIELPPGLYKTRIHIGYTYVHWENVSGDQDSEPLKNLRRWESRQNMGCLTGFIPGIAAFFFFGNNYELKFTAAIIGGILLGLLTHFLLRMLARRDPAYRDYVNQIRGNATSTIAAIFELTTISEEEATGLKGGHLIP